MLIFISQLDLDLGLELSEALVKLLLRLATDLRMVLEPDPLHLALDLVQLEDIKLGNELDLALSMGLLKGLVQVIMSLPVWLLLLLLAEPGLFEQGLGIDPELSLSLLAHLQVQGQLQPQQMGLKLLRLAHSLQLDKLDPPLVNLEQSEGKLVLQRNTGQCNVGVNSVNWICSQTTGISSNSKAITHHHTQGSRPHKEQHHQWQR